MEYEEEFVEEFPDGARHGYTEVEYHGEYYLADSEYDRQPETYNVPEAVRSFIVHLHKAINEGNVYELQRLYENDYVKLTDRFFKNAPWPLAKDVEPIVHSDEKFMILYQELYFRHIYARVNGGPNITERIHSYYNYCQLFNYLLSAEEPVQLELPNQWLWEIIDEFIYQFQNYSHYQRLVANKPPAEIEQMKENLKVWNVHGVLNVLHSLVDKSNINRQLEVYTNGGDPDSVAGEFGRHPLYKMLGYFSLVALLRLHSLLGDYYQAIKVLENIELNKKSLYSRVPACQVTTYYYVGFSYMMMRRYADAIRTFSNILLYIQRTQRNLFQQRTYQADQIQKQTERMYILLAICLALHPQSIDESVLNQLKERHGDKLNRMQHCDLDEFENSFSFACPKFLSPVPPNLDDIEKMDKVQLTVYHKQPYMAQLKVFLDEVQQQLKIPTIRSYLKLYTAMPVAKLAAFLAMPQNDFVSSLLCFKHKMKNLVWTKGSSGLEGEFQSGSEVDFYIDKDMIHIADTKVAHRYGDYFIRQIHKFEELHRLVNALKM